MTSSRGFYFRLLRVSMVQLLKARGFDRSKAETVDVMTDLYIRFLNLLVMEVQKLAAARQDGGLDQVALQDITQAFQNLGLVKPFDVLDVYDENPELYSDQGFRNFKEKCLHSQQRKQELLVSLPTTDLLEAENKTSKQPLSLIPEYINQIQNKDELGNKNNEENDTLLDELVNNGDFDDWVRFAMAKQKVQLSKKLTKNRPKDIFSLPPIASLKYSIMDPTGHVNFNNTVSNLTPSCPNKTDGEDGEEKMHNFDTIQSKLPIMNPQNKLESFSFLFEDGDEDDVIASKAESPSDNVNGKFEEVQDSNVGSFSLDADINTHFAEIEDMDNTFQRRDSIDFSNQQEFDQF